MALRNTPARWGGVAQALHWGMAGLILAMFALGLAAANWPLSPAKLELFWWHKSLGMLILALVLVRLLWRLTGPVPAPPPGTTPLERWAAAAAHGALYLLMVLMPVSGWVINSAAGFPFEVFGLVPLPSIVPKDPDLQGTAEAVHGALFLVLAALVVVHVAAALRHHRVRGNNVLRRMLPGRAGGGS